MLNMNEFYAGFLLGIIVMVFMVAFGVVSRTQEDTQYNAIHVLHTEVIESQ